MSIYHRTYPMQPIKKSIETQVKACYQLQDSLKKIKTSLANPGRNDRVIFNRIHKLLEKYPANTEVLILFTDFLQLANAKKILDQYDLEDILMVFDCLCKLHPNNHEIRLEYYYFLKNVLGKDKKAKKLMAGYRDRMNNNIKKVNKLLQEEDKAL
jgi:hypothetical protein